MYWIWVFNTKWLILTKHLLEDCTSKYEFIGMELYTATLEMTKSLCLNLFKYLPYCVIDLWITPPEFMLTTLKYLLVLYLPLNSSVLSSFYWNLAQKRGTKISSAIWLKLFLMPNTVWHVLWILKKGVQMGY